MRHPSVRYVLSSVAAVSIAATATASASAQQPTHQVRITARAHARAVSGSINVLHSFAGTDGANPQGALVYGVQLFNRTIGATLYGAAQAGGSAGDGTTWEQQLSPAMSFAPLFSFTGAGGAQPAGGLTSVPLNDYTISGPFIGVTQLGGKYGFGAIYTTNAHGAHQVLYSFTGGADGANPVGRLLFFNGIAYGTTSAGAAGFGTVFKFSSYGLKTLHTFSGSGADGGAPLAGLNIRVVIPQQNAAARAAVTKNGEFSPLNAPASCIDPDFYGVTSQGGSGGNGTIFKIAPSGQLTTLVAFDDNVIPGSSPAAELTPDLNGNLYGSTVNGGSAGVGEIFSYNPAGGFTVLEDFGFDPVAGAFPNGANPMGPVTLASNGKLYGTTSGGSFYGLGNVFEISPAGFALRYEFSGADGATPQSRLVEGLNHVLYGTTNSGGVNGVGEIFSIVE